MKILEYHEGDEEALKSALDHYAEVMKWDTAAKMTTESERELASRDLASISRIRDAIK